ncbi:hypothetical protein [Staphylococcus delphini]|uniref:hypothetical protein n=1 Tax=Staphylococcus delphini TaxID=53344 RepID=UPI0015C91886|nr:hypothetical protein [Staphylococcus delphini]
MKSNERYYDTKWRYDNHFNDDETKETLIDDAGVYIEELEKELEHLKDALKIIEEG